VFPWYGIILDSKIHQTTVCSLVYAANLRTPMLVPLLHRTHRIECDNSVAPVEVAIFIAVVPIAVALLLLA
jgi:hypothetical protein